jgi:hypothetical protein
MTDGVSGDGIFPVVTVRINDITCRALIDSGAGSSYASAKLIDTLKIKPREIKRQRINMLMTTQTARMEFYDTKISSIDGNYDMNVNLTKVDKTELLSINNPDYKGLIEQYQHLESVKMDDDDTKPQLPIHLVLGNGEYALIKTSTKPVTNILTNLSLLKISKKLLGQLAQLLTTLTTVIRHGWNFLMAYVMGMLPIKKLR